MTVERSTRKEKTTKKKKETIYKSTAASPSHLSQLLRLLYTGIHFGGNFPTSVAARKSITEWSHSSMGHNSEI
jgi:hypothetical protein